MSAIVSAFPLPAGEVFAKAKFRDDVKRNSAVGGSAAGRSFPSLLTNQLQVKRRGTLNPLHGQLRCVYRTVAPTVALVRFIQACLSSVYGSERSSHLSSDKKMQHNTDNIENYKDTAPRSNRHTVIELNPGSSIGMRSSCSAIQHQPNDRPVHSKMENS
jgi:hypothetical protein